MDLLDWYIVMRFPENLLIEAIRTSNTLLTWLCLYLDRFTCRDMDITKRYGYLDTLANINVSFVTNIHFYLFTCYFR